MCYSEITVTNWKNWLNISSKEEYESLALKLSGLSSVDDLFDRVRTEKTDPRKISVKPESLSDFDIKSEPLFLCHTSGTSGGQLSDLKWFHISKDLARRLWAPGMQAIFQASGLDTQTSAVIFVPTRNLNDGFLNVDGKELVKLYSSEFSQRLMLSLIKPSSYLLDEYRNANDVNTIAQILSMENIAIVSAPASTILGWADKDRLRRGLKKTSKTETEYDYPQLDLNSIIQNHGIDQATLEIQKRLSDHLSDSTLVFSISSITENEWTMIREFMQWKKGVEKFTNLYVGSEIGPFASTLKHDCSESNSEDMMRVFPLTLPSIENRGRVEIITRSKDNIGRLLVSRMNGTDPIINIDTGDVLSIESREGLPKISGEVLRSAFRLKTEMTFSPAYNIPQGFDIFVGDYFDFGDFRIINARPLVACLAERCGSNAESSILIRPSRNDSNWVLAFPQGQNCHNITDIRKSMSLCPGGKTIELFEKKGHITFEIVDQNPIETKLSRSELIKRVRKGELPKGVLKRWPLYVFAYREPGLR